MKQEIEIKNQIKYILSEIKKFSPGKSVELRIPPMPQFSVCWELLTDVVHPLMWWR